MHLPHPGIIEIRSPLVHFVKYQGGKQRQMNKKRKKKKINIKQTRAKPGVALQTPSSFIH